MTTSQPLTQSHIQPTLFAGDFLAKTSAQQVNKPASNRALGLASFTNSSESFAWYSPDTSCWKTSQRSLLTDWTPFLESWPKQGLMRNGHVFRRVLWAPATAGTAGGLLPTPVAQTSQGGPNGLNGGAGARQMLADAGFPRCAGAPTALPIGPDGTRDLLPTPVACVASDGERPETWLARRERVKLTANNGSGMGMPLTIAAQLLPTPTVNDAGNSTLPPSLRGRDSLPGQMLRDDSVPTGPGTHLNPSFVEEMMGFPVGWTA